MTNENWLQIFIDSIPLTYAFLLSLSLLTSNRRIGLQWRIISLALCLAALYLDLSETQLVIGFMLLVIALSLLRNALHATLAQEKDALLHEMLFGARDVTIAGLLVYCISEAIRL